MSSTSIANKVKIFIVKFFLRFLSILPFKVNRFFGQILGYIMWICNSRMCATTKTNVAKCLPHLNTKKKKLLVRRSCIHSGMTISESAWIWYNSIKKIQGLIKKIEGQDLIEKTLSNKKGVLLTGPHFGNWELVAFWAGLNFDTAAMYKAPKIKALDKILRKGRSKTGTKLFTGERASVRNMYKQLKEGNVFIILSDQEPELNSGVYAPFYEQPALTMTLIKKLVQKTDSTLLHFNIIRVKEGFNILIEEANFNTEKKEDVEFAGLLNKMIEVQINRCPEQYEWSYKRFKTNPNKIDIYNK